MKVSDYLGRLERLLAPLGPAEREDFVREMGSHIEELRARHPDQDEEAVVAGLTPPEDLARELVGTGGAATRRPEGGGARLRDVLRSLAELEVRASLRRGHHHGDEDGDEGRGNLADEEDDMEYGENDDSDEDDRLERELEAEGIETLTVRVLSADLRVEAAEGDRVRIRAEGGDAAGRLEIRREGDKLLVVERGERGPAIEELGIELPSSIAFAELTSASGEIRVESIGAQVAIVSASGDISLEACPGACSAESASGSIEASGVGAIKAKTASGDIGISAVAGDAAARSASGEVHLEEIGGAAAAETANGDIGFVGVGGRVGAKSASGDISLETCAGPIVVTTNSGSISIDCAEGFEGAEISSLSGDIEVSLPSGPDALVRAVSKSGEIRVGDRGAPRGEIILGAGGPELAVTSASGDITIDW